MLGEKEPYKYLGILEANTIKHVEIKEKKFKKSTSGEWGNYSKPNYLAGILSKGYAPGLSPCQILGIIFQVDEAGT